MSTLGGRTFVAPARFKPAPTRRVSPLTVVCPSCKADIGERCSAGSTHRVRHRMAVRLDNEARGI